MVPTHAESKETPAIRKLLDQATEAQLLSIFTEVGTGTIRVPLIDYAEDTEKAVQYSKSIPNWGRMVEEQKAKLAELVQSHSKIKANPAVPDSYRGQRVFQMLSESLAVTALEAKENRLQERARIDKKLHLVLEEFQRARAERVANHEKQIEDYTVRRKGLIKQFGQSWVEAIEKDAETWYQEVVKSLSINRLSAEAE